MASWSTHFWQKPKNQHTLLGMYGRQAKIAFFDLDEYLVLPSGRTVGETECFGKPILNMGDDGRTGSWVFIRYQARSCINATAGGGDMECWQQGYLPASSDVNLQLLHDVCPMSMGHGKHIIVPDMVDTISVHFAWAEGFNTNAMVNATCGYLLHFYALLNDRRSPVTAGLKRFPALRWDVDLTTGRRGVQWPEGLSPYAIDCGPLPTARKDKLDQYQAVVQRGSKAKPRQGQAVAKATAGKLVGKRGLAAAAAAAKLS